MSSLQPSAQSAVHPADVHRMITVREAFRLRRLASMQRRQWIFYVEHSLLDEARHAREEVLDSLRRACHQWRLTLGVAP